MSTRGLWGFTYEGTTKVTYNHYDSYPDGLGSDLVKALNKFLDGTNSSNPRVFLQSLVKDQQLVNEETPPTAEQVEQLLGYANLNVSTQSPQEWYVLLRETQGDLAATLACGYMVDGFEFGHDALFCEWGYVIDLDADEFVIYRGFSQKPVADGLWVTNGSSDSGYTSIMPIKRFPIGPEGVDINAWDAWTATGDDEDDG